MIRKSNKEIENESLEYVKKYLIKNGGKNIQRLSRGADIICDGKYIEVKGCMKRETNLRISAQTLKEVEKQDKLKQGSFFIYYVYDMKSSPKLMIFDYDTYNNKNEEIKQIIQPFIIHDKTKKPEIIELPKT